jgi:pimeloyl-ACP methyl ester carboxylesterase
MAFEELGGAAGGIGGVHRSIAGRVFGYVGPGGAPARIVHDGISDAVYSGLRGAARLAGRGAAAALATAGLAPTRPLSASPRGSLVVGALSGLTGDALEREGSPLHEPMAVRAEGEPVPIEAGALAAAFPGATGRLVMFLHGLMETEFSWRLAAGRHGGTYGSRLARDLGFTPVYVRYNSGRHISQNGRSLAGLMEELADAWPVDVEQIALVGHSMGGLVARSACHQAAEEGAAWPARVGHVVSLGSPHMGAPLAQAVHVASAVLHAVPETRPASEFLRRRSAGIRDLRHGSLVDEDWRGRDPDALRAVACREVPLLEGATHCFVAATITRSPRHPLGRLVGDCLVLVPSASGRSRARRIPFRSEHGMELGGASHFALLNHPQVYERLRSWLGADASLSARRPAPGPG